MDIKKLEKKTLTELKAIVYDLMVVGDVGTGTLSFINTGWANCSANINTTNLGDPGSGGMLYVESNCLIYIFNVIVLMFVKKEKRYLKTIKLQGVYKK